MDGVALTWRELDHQPDAARGGLIFSRDLDLTADHRHPGVLVDLVILQALPRRDLQDDRPATVAAVEDLGRVWTNRIEIRSQLFISAFNLLQRNDTRLKYQT